MTTEKENPILIYETAENAVEVRLDTDQETLWLTQAQMGLLFDVSPQNVTMHLKNIYAEGELSESATCKEFLQVQSDGGREVQRKRKHYSLDAVISVGYRISSARATQFRIWATRVLREHLTQGWTLNRDRFETNARELEAALELVRKTALSPELDVAAGRGLADIDARGAAGQPGPDGVWRARLPKAGDQGGASAVFCGQGPPGSRTATSAVRRSCSSISCTATTALLDAVGEPVINDVGLAALTLLVPSWTRPTRTP